MNLPYEREEKQLSAGELLATGKEILLKEAGALRAATERMGEEMAAAAHLVSRCRGRIVVTGLGKSGHVGRKTAATFASLGVPAFFLHATEGAHGDLGMVCREDVGYFISNSGETQELIALIPYFKRLGAPIIAVTGNHESTLAREADIVLNCHVDSEADPLKLAPTSSTTLQWRSATPSPECRRCCSASRRRISRSSTGGSLGKRLLLRVSDLMGSGDKMPVTNEDARVRDALFDITSGGYGAMAVVDGVMESSSAYSPTAICAASSKKRDLRGSNSPSPAR
ncbi:MAG: SIS domain-containing protein [Cloacibacillus evryensis]